LRNDGWIDDAHRWFQERLGPLKQKLFNKLDGAIRSIDKSVNATLTQVPKIYVNNYLSGGLRQLAEFRRTNIALIESVPRNTALKVGKIIQANPNLHSSDLAAKLSTVAKDSKQAELWARDQTLKAHAQVARAKHESVGIREYIWRTSEDERVRGRPGGKWANSRSNHWVLNGRLYRYDQPPIVDEYTGRQCNPGEDYECRCTAEPVLPKYPIAA
jgi:SPP1 gp7 family putative phage head morphogenesis protein